MDDWKLSPARDLGLSLGQRLRSAQREIGLIETAAHLGWWAMVRGYLALYHRLAVVGRENLPARPPFVMVGNHASHLDALVMAAPLPWRLRDRIFPIAAGDTFFESPLWSLFAVGMMNALPLWRRKAGARALTELRVRLVEEPCGYILFPEGTRSRDGVMVPFKAGLGMLIAGTSVPVVPCYLQGAYKALPPRRNWPRFHKITLRVGPALDFTGVANDREGWLHIAQTSEGAVRRLA